MRHLIATAIAFAPLTAFAQTCAPAPACLPAVSTLFNGLIPANANATDGVTYELGTAFQPASDGTVTAIRFYKAASETGAHIGHLWSADGSTLLATVNFARETASAWQSATLSKPVRLSAGATYWVSVNTNGYFPITTGGLSAPVTSGYLSTLSGTPSSAHSAAGTTGVFPTISYNGSNYFVDVAFRVSASLHTTQTPAIGETSDQQPYELGIRLIPAVNGQITGIRFWNTPDEPNGHVGHIWSDTGALLSTVTFTAEGGAGWHTAYLTKPLNVIAGQTYTASVNINTYYPDTLNALAAPGLKTQWLASATTGPNGVYGAPSTWPQTAYQASDYFRDIVFQPAGNVPPPPKPQPWHHRGYLGWIRDLASVPSSPTTHWPDVSVDQTLVNDYAKAGVQLKQYGATEVEIWGLGGAGGIPGSPGYNVDVETTSPPARTVLVKQIIATLHARGLKVVAGMGGMSWGVDQIAAANPSIQCTGTQYAADVINPLVDLSWTYQYRIIDYLMSFGVDGITVQSGDLGICNEGNPGNLDPVQYHAPIVDRIATYIKTKYPGAIVGSANYGIAFSNPADQSYVQQMAAHLDYLVDVNYTALQAGPGYRAKLAAAIAPTELASEADPNPAAPLHFDRLSWFLPMWQHDIANLQALYADGGRSAENYMRMQANPSDEVTTALFLLYEKDPSSSASANLDTVLKSLYKPVDAAALAQLRDLFTTGETAYFSNANSENATIEAYYDYNNRAPIYLRDNMTVAGRAAYRAALVTLLAEAQAVQPHVGNSTRVGDIITCLNTVIAQIDAL